jgi:hypothetical protein
MIYTTCRGRGAREARSIALLLTSLATGLTDDVPTTRTLGAAGQLGESCLSAFVGEFFHGSLAAKLALDDEAATAQVLG